MEFQLLSTTVGDNSTNPCTTAHGNSMRPCCSENAQKLCSFSSGCFFILTLLSLFTILHSLCFG